MYYVKFSDNEYVIDEFADQFIDSEKLKLSDYIFTTLKLLILKKATYNLDLKEEAETIILNIDEMLDEFLISSGNNLDDRRKEINISVCHEIRDFLNKNGHR